MDWLGPRGFLAALSLALLLCAPAAAMDAAARMGESSPRSSPSETASAATTTKARDVRREPKAKRPPKSATGSRARHDGKKLRKSIAKKRGPAVAKLTSGRRLNPPPSEAFREIQPSLAEGCMERIDNESQPGRIVQLSEECGGSQPNEILAGRIRRTGEGARQAMEAQKTAGISADLFVHPEGNPDLHALVLRAARGDMYAAHRIADAYKSGLQGVQANTRRMEQWLRFAAELGNGRASWELADHYNYGGLVADAAKYEKKAEDLGYRPGPRLPSRGY